MNSSSTSAFGSDNMYREDLHELLVFPSLGNKREFAWNADIDFGKFPIGGISLDGFGTLAFPVNKVQG